MIKCTKQQAVGKTDYQIAAWDQGEVSVWTDDIGQSVDSGENVQAMALNDLDGNKFVHLALGEVRDDEGLLIYEGWLASAWEA